MSAHGESKSEAGFSMAVLLCFCCVLVMLGGCDWLEWLAGHLDDCPVIFPWPSIVLDVCIYVYPLLVASMSKCMDGLVLPPTSPEHLPS